MLKILLLAYCLLSLPLYAANLVTILVADTKDDVIGRDCHADIKRMASLAQNIAKYTDLKLVVRKIENLPPQDILNELKSIVVGPEDVLLFYYTGHGYRTEDIDSPWPVYEFPGLNQGLSSAKAVSVLEKKMPRFLLAIHDCCNVFLEEDEEIPTLIKASRIPVDESRIVRNYRNLFLGYSGTITIASSSPGEYSFTSDAKLGAQYTLAFLKSLKEEVQAQNTLWEIILEKTARYVNDDEQHPVWSMQISSLENT